MKAASSNNKELRKSNLELLRIISMLMITFFHFSVHGGFEFSNTIINFNRLYLQFIQIGGRIGVDIFVLISGYFLIESSKTKIQKLMVLWLQIFTYSISIFFGLVVAGIQEFSTIGFLKACLPITFSQWWFASAYFVLYLIHPVINKLLNSLSKDEYRKCILLFLVIWCIIPTFTHKQFESNNLLWIIYVYSIAGYFRKFGIKISNKKILLGIFSLTFLTFLSAVLMDLIGTKYKVFSDHSTYFYVMFSFPVLLISIFIFLYFLNHNVKYNRFINGISKTTFAIYLLHDHNDMSSFLWIKVFQNASYQTSKLLVPYSIAVVLIVFVGGVIIELLRKFILEKFYINLCISLSSKVEKVIEKHYQ